MKRAVICEDESITRKDIRETLTERGYVVVGDAGDGVTALHLCLTTKPDFVVLDIKTPGMDGISVAEQLVSRLKDKAPAVILITAYREKELVSKAADVLVDAYLLKPINEDQLCAAVEVALSRRQLVASLREKLEATERKLASRIVVERAKGIVMDQLKCTEEEAYRKLQLASMRLRAPIDKVCQVVVYGTDLRKLLEVVEPDTAPGSR